MKSHSALVASSANRASRDTIALLRLAIKNLRSGLCSDGLPAVRHPTRCHLMDGGNGGRSFSSDIKCLAIIGL